MYTHWQALFYIATNSLWTTSKPRQQKNGHSTGLINGIPGQSVHNGLTYERRLKQIKVATSALGTGCTPRGCSTRELTISISKKFTIWSGASRISILKPADLEVHGIGLFVNALGVHRCSQRRNMKALVIAEHDNRSIKAATLHTVTAAAHVGGDIHVLVAGDHAQEAAAASCRR